MLEKIFNIKFKLLIKNSISKYKKIYTFFLLVILSLMPFICDASTQCVILLHGLGRTSHSMSKLESYLKYHSYIVINQNYPSTKEPIKILATKYLPIMINQCLKYQPDNIYFVTHSLGGIVLRKYLENHQLPKSTHIVMLAPPNHGSQLADLLHNNWFFRTILGPAGQELTTNKNSTPNSLPCNLPYQVGIIAGNYNFLPLTQLLFHECNDGKVTVSSTKIAGMKDFILLPVGHTFMMNNLMVMQQVLFFLSNSRFKHYTEKL